MGEAARDTKFVRHALKPGRHEVYWQGGVGPRCTTVVGDEGHSSSGLVGRVGSDSDAGLGGGAGENRDAGGRSELARSCQRRPGSAAVARLRNVALPDGSIPSVAHVSASTQASGVASDKVTGKFDSCQLLPPS